MDNRKSIDDVTPEEWDDYTRKQNDPAMCECGHKGSDHNNADNCITGLCLCKRLRVIE